MKPAKFKASVSLYSNSPGQPTGYGQQAEYLVERLKRAGCDVAAMSNYGLEGNNGKINTKYGQIEHYARGLEAYSTDVLPIHHAHFKGKYKGQKDLLITLYDVWVLKNKALDALPIAAWVPLDHTTMPPMVKKFLEKDNVTPIAMAPHGVRQMQELGIECEYVPHGIDTKIFKPTRTIEGQNVRKFMGVTDDQFVVGMVSANKANGVIHRKAYAENFLAFALFHKTHPNSVLYVHADPLPLQGGFNLLDLAGSVGIPKDAILFPNSIDYRYGFSQHNLAALYTGMDVMLSVSYGEGFGIPTVEAQACGTRVIGSSWAATADLVADDGWLVEGQPFWDEGQKAWYNIPLIPSIVNALNLAYEAPREKSRVAIDFAANFDVEHVWENHWVPVLEKLLK
jgi:glycosyltransferase involved in cell wall biosynthesis